MISAMLGTLAAMAFGARRMPEPIMSPTATATPNVTPRIFRRCLRSVPARFSTTLMLPPSLSRWGHVRAPMSKKQKDGGMLSHPSVFLQNANVKALDSFLQFLGGAEGDLLARLDLD